VVGDLHSVPDLANGGKYRVVSVAQTAHWSPQQLHHLAWDLEDTGAELVVDPRLMEIAHARLHITAVDGLPLLRLTEPAFTGAPHVVKWTIDRLGAALLLLVTAPLIIVSAIAVRSDGGPIFTRQLRVGKAGKLFTMMKFRSMAVNVDQFMSGLATNSQRYGTPFNVPEDPRVTRVGRLLRRYSLDELPRLFNVLFGSMSLVGPRPLREEDAMYSWEAQRTLLVKPGLTGLWRISHRSNLSWEEAIRLDIRYVENWTLALDALIVWKTITAVLRDHGP
jgi:lipopolysaccharide/colanic/teichoic acid biosynthesis glycosyltransferase